MEEEAIAIALSSDMVSTPLPSSAAPRPPQGTPQYITEYALPAVGSKSPLAMLAKTCETIGLQGGSSKKASEKKVSPKKDISPSPSIKCSSASSYPTSTTTMPPLLAGMPFMPFHPMMSLSSFPRPPCPNILMNRLCTTAGCPSCTPPTAEMLSALSSSAMNPLFSAYANPFLPSTSTAGMLPPYGFLSAGLPPSMASLPSMQPPSSYPSSFPCAMPDCGKSFASLDDLSSHLKSSHSLPSSGGSDSPGGGGKASSKSSPASSARYNPYGKTLPPPSAATAPLVSPLSTPFMPSYLPFPFHAMYQQRMMSTLPML